MATQSFKRPDSNEYYMGLAIAVRERANCKGSRVGAVLVLEDRVISTGYNGVPEGMTNCDDGGCLRCANRGKQFKAGTGYDVCICVHAEQNALLTAARFGIEVQGASLYTTRQPCFGCAKEMLQARIQRVFYLHTWDPEQDLRSEYKKILKAIPEVCRIDVSDPHKDWSLGGERIVAA